MARFALIAVMAVCAAFASSALSSRETEAQRQLKERLRELHSARALLQDRAVSTATGTTSATSFASAGGGQAQTRQTATGPGATVAGLSQVGQKVDTCQRGPADSAACQTLTTADRSTLCSDIAPDNRFTCEEQASFGKCDSDFIYLGAYCLKSCNRCGDSCTDVAPSGMACAAAQCNATEITSAPYCLKLCGRCSTAA